MVMDWDGTYRDLRRRNWIILLVLAAGSAYLGKVDVTLGIIAGGLAVILNFTVLQHTIRHAFTSESAGKAKKVSLLVKSYLRLVLLGITIYILITRGLVDPIGLTVGLSTVVFSIVTFGIHRVLTGSPSKN
jgi:hypothetical protein